MTRLNLLSLEECGRRFRNLIIRDCRYLEELNAASVGLALRIIRQSKLTFAPCISEFLSSRFLPNIFAAKGQLARKHSLHLILQDKCIKYNQQELETVLVFASGMLHGADDHYGALLKESPREAERKDDTGVKIARRESIYSRHGDTSIDAFTLRLDDQDIEVESDDELLLKILKSVVEVSDNEYKEWVTLLSRSNQEIWMMCYGNAGDMRLRFSWGDPKDIFATNMYETVSIEKAVLTMHQYASGCEEWWTSNNWFRQYD